MQNLPAKKQKQKQKQNLTSTSHFTETKPFPPLGSEAELVIYDDDNNNFTIPLLKTYKKS